MTTRKTYLDVLRILATYSVVLLHTASKKIGGGYQDTLLVYDGLVRWAVPMFVMISGSIFLDGNYNVSIGKMWKKILRLIIAMAFWTGIYCIFEMSRGTEWKSIQGYLLNGYWHLWYIWLISALYMITPILKVISQNRQLTGYFLILSLIFASVIPTLRYSIIPYTGMVNNEIVIGLLKNVDTMNLQFVMGFTGLYLLGHYLDETVITKGKAITCLIVGFVGFIINIAGNLILTHTTGKLIQTFNDSLRLNVVMECVGLYVGFKYCMCSHGERKSFDYLSKIASYCFGAYLVHLLYRELLDMYMGWNAETFFSAIWTPVLALIIFILSMLTSFFIHQIPVLKKWVV